MTYDTLRIEDARIPVTVVELTLDHCAEAFGVSPCTASGAAGTECYNTYDTCQDIANYNKSTKVIRLYQPVNDWPIGEHGYPCIKNEPTYTSCVIDPKGSLGKRGSVSIKCHDFADDDIYTDPYFSTRTYNAEEQGTFFGKLKARTPYYKGRPMRVGTGYIGLDGSFSWNNFKWRYYVIETLDYDLKGNVTITGKDLLKLADDKKATIPAASTGSLSVAYTASGTTLTLQTGEGVDYDTDPYTGNTISGTDVGYVRIESNVLKYTGVTGDQLTGVVGGQFGSTDEDLSIDANVQQCFYVSSKNIVDIIHYALKDVAGIDESYLPYDAGLTVPTGTDDEWDIEKSSWLSANDLTHIETKPVGLSKLLKRLCEQNLVYIWYDEKEQEVKLRAIAPELKNVTPVTLTDDANLLKDSIKVSDHSKKRISQIWVYYDIVDVTEDRNKPENYHEFKIQVDTDSENANAYDEKAIRVIYADWLSSANAGLILTLAGRLLGRYAGTPSLVNLKIDTKDIDFWTGATAYLNTIAFQGSDGANLIQKMQVIKASENHDKQIVMLEAETWDFEISRYAFVAADTMGDYTAETTANQDAYGFICQNDGEYTNGDKGHLIA